MKVLVRSSTPEELQRQLSLLDIAVPLRSEGRTTQHTERHCIAHLLSSLPLGRLSFPITVFHTDRPDFILCGSTSSVGVEHTEAVPPNTAHASALRDSGLGPDVYFIQPASPGEPKLTAAEIREQIELDDPGDGWVGDSAEREWADAMLSAAMTKVQKAQKPGFKRLDQNWLLIYDNWPLPVISIPRAAEQLEQQLRSSQVFDTFDSVFILDSTSLCEFRRPYAIHDVLFRRVDS